MRTPLTTILGWTDLLMRECRRQASVEQLQKILPTLQMIHEGAETLLAIVTDILEVSKVEQGVIEMQKEPFMMKRLLAKCERLIQMRIKDAVTFKLESRLPDDCCFLGDSNRLTQVLTNLLTNAAKFTDRGSITLSVEVLPVSSPLVTKIGPSAQHSAVYFSVTDTGIGIPPDKQSRLFRSFSQVDDRAKAAGGYGLGLGIVPKLVEKMGGDVNVESRVGVGSKFSFFVFLERCSSSQMKVVHEISSPMPPIASLSRHSGKRVLLAEDNKMNQMLLRRMLLEFGLECDVAGDGQEAVNLAREKRYALILMDYLMPVMNGIEAIQLIKLDSRNADAPVVVLSAAADLETRQQFVQAGVNGFLSKPVTLDQLLATLDRYIDDRT